MAQKRWAPPVEGMPVQGMGMPANQPQTGLAVVPMMTGMMTPGGGQGGPEGLETAENLPMLGGSRITEEMLRKATRTMHKYRAG